MSSHSDFKNKKHSSTAKHKHHGKQSKAVVVPDKVEPSVVANADEAPAEKALTPQAKQTNATTETPTPADSATGNSAPVAAASTEPASTAAQATSAPSAAETPGAAASSSQWTPQISTDVFKQMMVFGGGLILLSSIGSGSRGDATPPATPPVTPPAPQPVDPGTAHVQPIDGYLANALIWRDADDDKTYDAGELYTFTDANGNAGALTNGAGSIRVAGLTPALRALLSNEPAADTIDISTGKVFSGVLSAPDGSSVVTPLTTLVVAVGNGSGASATLSSLKGALGIDASVDLANFDPLAAMASGGDAAAALAIQSAGIQVASLMTMAVSALQSGGSTMSVASIVSSVATSLVSQVGNASAGSLLTSPTVLSAALQSAASSSGLSGAALANLSSSLSAASTALAAVNSAIKAAVESAIANGGGSLDLGSALGALTNVVAAQLVVIDNLLPQVAAAAVSGNTSFASSFTANLSDQIAASTAKVKTLVNIPPGQTVLVAVDDSATLNISNQAWTDKTGNLLSNDVVSGGSMLVEMPAGQESRVLTGTYGTLTIAANGAYTYTVTNAVALNTDTAKASNGQVQETFDYTVKSGNKSDTGALIITLDGANKAPQLVASKVSALVKNHTLGDALNIDASQFFSDANNDTLTYSLRMSDGQRLPSGISINASTGAITGTLDAAWLGRASLIVTAVDGSQAHAQAEFTLQTSAPTPGFYVKSSALQLVDYSGSTAYSSATLGTLNKGALTATFSNTANSGAGLDYDTLIALISKTGTQAPYFRMALGQVPTYATAQDAKLSFTLLGREALVDVVINNTQNVNGEAVTRITVKHDTDFTATVSGVEVTAVSLKAGDTLGLAHTDGNGQAWLDLNFMSMLKSVTEIGVLGLIDLGKIKDYLTPDAAYAFNVGFEHFPLYSNTGSVINTLSATTYVEREPNRAPVLNGVTDHSFDVALTPGAPLSLLNVLKQQSITATDPNGDGISFLVGKPGDGKLYYNGTEVNWSSHDLLVTFAGASYLNVTAAHRDLVTYQASSYATGGDKAQIDIILKDSDGAYSAPYAMHIGIYDIALSGDHEIAENTIVGTGVFVGNISGLDTQTAVEDITLSGADADQFKIVKDGDIFKLYFKGSSPDYEAQTSYTVRINGQAFAIDVLNQVDTPTLAINTVLVTDYDDAGHAAKAAVAGHVEGNEQDGFTLRYDLSAQGTGFNRANLLKLLDGDNTTTGVAPTLSFPLASIAHIHPGAEGITYPVAIQAQIGSELFAGLEVTLSFATALQLREINGTLQLNLPAQADVPMTLQVGGHSLGTIHVSNLDADTMRLVTGANNVPTLDLKISNLLDRALEKTITLDDLDSVNAAGATALLGGVMLGTLADKSLGDLISLARSLTTLDTNLLDVEGSRLVSALQDALTLPNVIASLNTETLLPLASQVFDLSQAPTINGLFKLLKDAVTLPDSLNGATLQDIADRLPQTGSAHELFSQMLDLGTRLLDVNATQLLGMDIAKISDEVVTSLNGQSLSAWAHAAGEEFANVTASTLLTVAIQAAGEVFPHLTLEQGLSKILDYVQLPDSLSGVTLTDLSGLINVGQLGQIVVGLLDDRHFTLGGLLSEVRAAVNIGDNNPASLTAVLDQVFDLSALPGNLTFSGLLTSLSDGQGTLHPLMSTAMQLLLSHDATASVQLDVPHTMGLTEEGGQIIEHVQVNVALDDQTHTHGQFHFVLDSDTGHYDLGAFLQGITSYMNTTPSTVTFDLPDFDLGTLKLGTTAQAENTALTRSVAIGLDDLFFDQTHHVEGNELALHLQFSFPSSDFKQDVTLHLM
jgi:VCBS repeat-containing protein